MRLDRLLSIVIILLNQNRITARELAEKFEVSVRTIYRDIDSINYSGIPIVTYPGNNGGFGIMENYKIDRHILKLDDMFSILSALKGLNNAFEDRKLDSVIEKISSLVPTDKNYQKKLYFEQIVIDILPWGFGKKHKEKMSIIQKAIFENRLLNFFYRNSKGETATRIIEAMTLIFKGYASYLFAYCRLKNDFRLFRLSRMKNIKILDRQFERKKDSFKTHFSNIDCKKNVDLILKFPPTVRTKVEDYFQEKQIKILETGDMIVKASFPLEEWVYSMIFSFGENLEILNPAHVREIVQKKIEKMRNIYKHDIQLSNE